MIRSLFSTFLVLQFAFTSIRIHTAFSNDAEPCLVGAKKELEIFFGQEVEVYRLDVPENSMLHDLFPEKDPIALGVSPKGHAYLIAGEKRYDGELMKPGSFKDGHISSDGYLFHLDGMSEARRARLVERIAKEEVSTSQLSCVHDVCNRLKEGLGAEINPGKKMPISPSEVYKALIKKGLVDETGKPLKMTIYRLSDSATLKSGYKEMANYEVNLILFASAVSVGVGAGINLLVIRLGDSKMDSQLKKPKPDLKK